MVQGAKSGVLCRHDMESRGKGGGGEEWRGRGCERGEREREPRRCRRVEDEQEPCQSLKTVLAWTEVEAGGWRWTAAAMLSVTGMEVECEEERVGVCERKWCR